MSTNFSVIHTRPYQVKPFFKQIIMRVFALSDAKHITTWSYENWVSKHFVIFLNFLCLIAQLLCCVLMSFVFACFVVRGLCRSGCRQNYYLSPPPPPPPSLPSYFFCHYPQFSLYCNTSDSYLKSVRA